MTEKLTWHTMETAPKDREILLFGSDGYGDEMTAFASWQVFETWEWEVITSTDDEQHKKRVKKEDGRWDTGGNEIFPALWADVERPMRRQKQSAG